METNERLQSLTKMSPHLFTTLQPAKGKKKHLFTAQVNFSSYSSLMCTVNDLMKLITLVHLSDEMYVSDTVPNPIIDLANIMELAIQLMPINEAEFLDEARGIFVPPQHEMLPQYNYSTVKVLKLKKKKTEA
jgi:regulatory protein YycH of two-component signal transduction system YycFG